MATIRNEIRRTVKHRKKALHSLWNLFSWVEDPRKARGKRYELPTLLSLVVIGFLCGADNMAKLERILNEKPMKRHLNRVFKLNDRIPSHDTFSRVMALIDENELAFVLEVWVYELIGEYRGHYAIDGKAVSSATKLNEVHKFAPYILNAYVPAYNLVTSMSKVGEKTNENPHMKKLLPTLHVADSFITADALHTTDETMEDIRNMNGFYFFCVKDNRSKIQDELDLVFDDRIGAVQYFNETDAVHVYTLFEKNKDRHEYRDIAIFHTDGIEVMYNPWGIRTAGAVRRRTKRLYTSGKTRDYSDETVYYITNGNITDDLFIHLCRAHWAIENSLHYVLDERFREDRSTARTGNAIENLAALRRIAFNLVSIAKSDSEGYLDPEHFLINFNETVKFVTQPQRCPKSCM